MTIIRINDMFSVSGELNEQELMSLIKNGLTNLINVRPDNETANQKPSSYWRAMCEQASIDYFYIPVLSGQYPNDKIKEFAQVLLDNKQQTHCFCRSGTRAVHLYALANKNMHTYEYLNSLIKSKGFDLAPIYEQFNK